MERCHPTPLSFIDKSVILGAWLPDDLLSPGLGMRGSGAAFASTQVHQDPACLFPHPDNFLIINSFFSKPTQPNQASGIRPKGSLGGGENPAFSSFLSGQFCVSRSSFSKHQEAASDSQTWILVWTRLPAHCVTWANYLASLS